MIFEMSVAFVCKPKLKRALRRALEPFMSMRTTFSDTTNQLSTFKLKCGEKYRSKRKVQALFLCVGFPLAKVFGVAKLEVLCCEHDIPFPEWLYLQDGEEKDQQEDDTKGIEMEGDFDGQMEDLPPNDDSASEEDGDEDRLQQEMGDVGEAGDTVDERLWNEEDKPEESQQGPPKKENDSTVQASPFERATVIIVIFFSTASGERCLSCILTALP